MAKTLKILFSFLSGIVLTVTSFWSAIVFGFWSLIKSLKKTTHSQQKHRFSAGFAELNLARLSRFANLI